MKNFIKNKLTIFLVIGILTFLLGGLFCLDIIFNGVSASTKLYAMYLLTFGMIPILGLIIIDRICVWKYGAKKVNKTQLYILCGLFSLFVVNWIRIQLSI